MFTNDIGCRKRSPMVSTHWFIHFLNIVIVSAFAILLFLVIYRVKVKDIFNDLGLLDSRGV